MDKPKNIEVFEGSTLRVEKQSSDDSTALSFVILHGEDFIVMESVMLYHYRSRYIVVNGC